MSKSDTQATQALERAAHAAVFGSREARSGRFNLAFTDEKRAAGMILREAQAAYQSWANWEAINDQFAQQRVRDAIIDLEFGAIDNVRTALGRDALLRAFALSDVYGATTSPERLTLCQFAMVFEDQSNVENLITQEWACDLGHSKVAANGAAQRNKVRIESFQSLIASNWKHQAPTNPEFHQLREAIRPIRNRLAHAIDVDFDAPTVDQVRRLIHLTLELATDMAFVFLGTASGAQEFADVSRQQANKFWGFALQGAVRASPASTQPHTNTGTIN